MKTNFKHTMIAAVMAAGTLISTGSAAHADIDDWLRSTFSSTDWVGDWLKDTFGPVMNSGGQDGGKADFDWIRPAYKDANEIASGWAPGQKIMDPDTLAGMKPVCDLLKLLKVVTETKSPEALLKHCFVQGK